MMHKILSRMAAGLAILALSYLPVAKASATEPTAMPSANDQRHEAPGHWVYEVCIWDAEISPEEGWIRTGFVYDTVEKARDLATIYELDGIPTKIEPYILYDDEQ
jgi:hypothetical protein